MGVVCRGCAVGSLGVVFVVFSVGVLMMAVSPGSVSMSSEMGMGGPGASVTTRAAPAPTAYTCAALSSRTAPSRGARPTSRPQWWRW